MPSTPAKASALPLVLLLAACAGNRPVAAPLPAPSPSPEAAVEIEETFAIEASAAAPAPARDDLLGSTRYDLPVVANPWVQLEVDFLVGQRRSTIGRWMQQGERYQEWVQEVFAGYGLPRDLHHLAMVESGYTPTARSHAGALGMWQFMPSTGRGMGLRIDDLVDERMDPVRSTHAAARHLRDLHRSFGGDWALAAAAYNAGSGRISRGLGRFGVRNFWDLAERGDLAQETRHYVPRLYAVTIIARDPERFGYATPQGAVRRFAYDSVRVDVPTPLDELARLSRVPLAELTGLNPHLLRGMAPANYWVWTPQGMGAAVQVAFDSSAFRREGGQGFYTLRRGETVEDLAAASGLSIERIRDLNLSRRLDRLSRGDRLRLPAPAVRMLESRPAARLAESGGRSERSRAARPTRRDAESGTGEEAARTSEAPASRASEESRGESGARSGRRAASSDREETRASESRTEASARSGRRAATSERTSEERPRPRVAAASRGGRSHTVESGETLWGIARRFDVTVVQLREANELDEGAALQPGQALRIPRAAAAQEEEAPRRASPTPTAEKRAPASREATDAQHTVRSGDTLWSIARQYDTSVDAIRAANRMDGDAPIQPGQRLRVPRAR